MRLLIFLISPETMCFGYVLEAIRHILSWRNERERESDSGSFWPSISLLDTLPGNRIDFFKF